MSGLLITAVAQRATTIGKVQNPLNFPRNRAQAANSLIGAQWCDGCPERAPVSFGGVTHPTWVGPKMGIKDYAILLSPKCAFLIYGGARVRL